MNVCAVLSQGYVKGRKDIMQRGVRTRCNVESFDERHRIRGNENRYTRKKIAAKGQDDATAPTRLRE